MKIEGRVKAVGLKGARWSALVSGKWVSQFMSEKITADLKAALEAVKEGETWEFDVVEAKSSAGATYLNVVGAAKTEDTGQDSGAARGGHDESPDTATRIARAAACHDAAQIVSAMIRAGQSTTPDDVITIAKRISQFTLTGE